MTQILYPTKWNEEEPWKNHEPLIRGIAEGKLVLFVGNGVSRLADPPVRGWGDLFNDPSLRLQAAMQQICLKDLPPETPLVELAQVFRDNPGARTAFVGTLRRAFMNASPGLIHDLLLAFEPLLVLTTNIDCLLEQAGINAGIVHHLHGILNGESSWVFSISDYHRARSEVIKIIRDSVSKDNIVLFVGYGHPSDDTDIWEAITSLPPDVARYSIMPEHDLRGLRRYRLLRENIIPLTIPIPRGGLPVEWELGVAGALHHLLSIAGINLPPAVLDRLDQKRMAYQQSVRGGVVSVGLTSYMTHSFMADFHVGESHRKFPLHNRVNMAREEVSEVGGPGAITSIILSELGIPSYLFSKIANDSQGDLIMNTLDAHRSNTAVDSIPKLFHDFVEIGDANEKDFENTAKSYVLVHPSDGQRVFLDRKWKPGFFNRKLELSTDMEPYGPRFLYFDKFLGPSVVAFLSEFSSSTTNPNYPITFFETGERGNNSFDDTLRGKVNFLLASWRYLCNYFLNEVGGDCSFCLPDMVSTNGKERPISHKEEVASIQEVIQDDQRRNDLIEKIFDCSQWFPCNGPAVCVVTLHGSGVLVVDLRKRYSEFIPTEIVETPVNTASAGDVFRACFVAVAVQKITGSNLSFEDLKEACDFGNWCARQRIQKRTLTESLVSIAEEFHTRYDAAAGY